MKKVRILKSLVVLSLVCLAVIGATGANYSDIEESAPNAKTAGSLDLKIANDSYYNGVASPVTTFSVVDLTSEVFFDFSGIKPRDWGEDTITMEIGDNDSWLCANVTLTSAAENSVLEPEAEALDSVDNGTWDGELDDELYFLFWADDGDNVYEDDESPLLLDAVANLPQGDGNTGYTFTLADSVYNEFTSLASDPLTPGTYYLGKAWCYGTLTPAPLIAGTGVNPIVDPGITCDSSITTNVSQTDDVTGNISFYVEQSRNNASFVCGSWNPNP